MVRWLGPHGLFVTGVDLALSAIFGRYADKRELFGALPTPVPRKYLDDEIWIDFVADLGDGWDTTFSVATVLCDEPLTIDADVTHRGKILIFGGDAVYPRADWGEYQDRLVDPYSVASKALRQDEQDLYAIPGNHDWYDGLTSFTRLFLSNRSFAAWETPQRRSYFALQLPHNWWILGIDVAFDYYLDEAQQRYFWELRFGARKRIRAGDNIILCTAKPGWATKGLAGGSRTLRGELGRDALIEFERQILEEWRCNLPLVLSGDLHHYSRYVSEGGARQRITCGTGGAYLFPTHPLPPTVKWGVDGKETLWRDETYPKTERSEGMRWRIPFGPFKSLAFLAFTGSAYLVIASQMRGAIRSAGHSWYRSVLEAGPSDLLVPLINRPLSGLLVTILIVGLIAFADARSRTGRVLMGLAHGVGHMSALIGAVFLSISFTEWLLGLESTRGPDLLIGAAAILVFCLATVAIGGAIGGMVMGVYLWISQVFLQRHPNEAFAALALESHKGFVRLHIDHEGRLAVYPIGLERPARWRIERDGESESLITGDELTKTFIEEPFMVPARDSEIGLPG
jgi:hypothetical protein